MTFYLGTHLPHWLYREELADIPLFLSARRLRDQARWKPSSHRWALDSGGFTELKMYGRWTVSPEEYVDDVRRWFGEIGPADWCAPQDWMCEKAMLERTGFSVVEHQWRTVENYLKLRLLAPDLPFIPVLQGWAIEDYMRHVDDYAVSGVNLASFPLVGVGSVCRRQHTDEVAVLMAELCGMGIRPHGFGLKVEGIKRCSACLASADSMAWSYQARRLQRPMPECVDGGHKNCANCHRYATKWYREKIVPVMS